MPPMDELAAKIPALKTKRVLLVIDLINDFLSLDADLAVTTPRDLSSKIRRLIPQFREHGDVIWVRSEFQEAREFNSSGNDSIVLPPDVDSTKIKATKKPTPSRYTPSKKALALLKSVAKQQSDLASSEEADSDSDVHTPSEAFLSVGENGQLPVAFKPGTSGSKLIKDVQDLIDKTKDSLLTKTFYSAFHNTSLVQSLRSNLVVNVYICGVISNISVFATAVDAAKHGFSVHIIEDCIGYRSLEAHQMALKQMIDDMGINKVMQSNLDLDTDISPSQDSISTPSDAVDNKSSLPQLDPKNSQPLDQPSPSQVKAGSASRNQSSPGSTRPDKPAEPEQPKEVRLVDRTRKVIDPNKLQKSIEKVERKTDSGKETSDYSESPIPEPPLTSEGIKERQTNAKDTKELSLLGVVPKVQRLKKKQPDPPLGPQDKIGEGDSRIIYNFLDAELEKDIFNRLKKEVRWKVMYHRGGEVPRLVAVEGEVSPDNSFPIYRHPADESPPLLPFSSTVLRIRDHVQKTLKHPINHVLIQLYRSGQDYISEHSDKTLDIVRGSSIVNVSIGAQRTMTLRAKKAKPEDSVKTESSETTPRDSQKIVMPHNSMFVLGQRSNMKWLHAVRQDKRLDSEKLAEELDYNGERISLTFRQIGTFVDEDISKIWGQGAKSKMKEHAGPVVNGDDKETERMVFAFGTENHSTRFDWDAEYGEGFDVVNFFVSKVAKLSCCRSSITGLRAELLLAEKGISFDWVELSNSPCKKHQKDKTFQCFASQIKFVDCDVNQTEIYDEATLLVYLGIRSNASEKGLLPDHSNSIKFATAIGRLHRSLLLSEKIEALLSSSNEDCIFESLDEFERYLSQSSFIAGDELTIADIAFAPVIFILHNRIDSNRFTHLKAYLQFLQGHEQFEPIVARYKRLWKS
jgi:nicotinamidase-related amidase/alkylated DNA repair dioxygenase AlkB